MGGVIARPLFIAVAQWLHAAMDSTRLTRIFMGWKEAEMKKKINFLAFFSTKLCHRYIVYDLRQWGPARRQAGVLLVL